jgi:hypothetical protein
LPEDEGQQDDQGENSREKKQTLPHGYHCSRFAQATAFLAVRNSYC